MKVIGTVLVWAACVQAWNRESNAQKKFLDAVEARAAQNDGVKIASVAPPTSTMKAAAAKQKVRAAITAAEKEVPFKHPTKESVAKSLRTGASLAGNSLCASDAPYDPNHRVAYCDHEHGEAFLTSKACERAKGTWVDTTCQGFEEMLSMMTQGSMPTDLNSCANSMYGTPAGYVTMLFARMGCCGGETGLCTELSGLEDRFCPAGSFQGDATWNECQNVSDGDDRDLSEFNDNRKMCMRAGGKPVTTSCTTGLEYINIASGYPDWTAVSEESFCHNEMISSYSQFLDSKGCCGTEKATCVPNTPSPQSFCNAPSDYVDNTVTYCEYNGEDRYDITSERWCRRAKGKWVERTCSEQWDSTMYYLIMAGVDVEDMINRWQTDPESFCNSSDGAGQAWEADFTMKELLTHLLDNPDCCGPLMNVCNTPTDGAAMCTAEADYTPSADVYYCDDQKKGPDAQDSRTCKRYGGRWMSQKCSTLSDYFFSMFPDDDLHNTDPLAYCKQCVAVPDSDDEDEICVNQIMAHLDDDCCGTGQNVCRSVLPHPSGTCENTQDFNDMHSIGVCSVGYPGQFRSAAWCQRAGGQWSMETCGNYIRDGMLKAMNIFDFDLINTDLEAYCAQPDDDGLSIAMVLESFERMGCCGSGVNVCKAGMSK